MSKARAGTIRLTLLLDLGFKLKTMGGDISMVSQSVLEGSGSLNLTSPGTA